MTEVWSVDDPAQSDMENWQAFKKELQSDRNRVFRLVTGGTGA